MSQNAKISPIPSPSSQNLPTLPTNIDRAALADAVRSTAILADLTIAMWSGERTDQSLMTRLKQDTGAVGNTGRVIKNLLAGSDTELKAVKATYAAARQLHYQLTLPWVSDRHAARDTGPRLLPNMLFQRYLTEMTAMKRQAEQKLNIFLDDYPTLVKQAQANLASMANVADYPDLDEVRECFRLSFDFSPIPPASAFAGLPDVALDVLGKKLEERQASAAEAATAALWGRVHEQVTHLVERLAATQAGDGKFKATTVESVRELITLLPQYNCTRDGRVPGVVAEIERMLDGVDAETLRKNESARNDTLAKARALSAKLDAWKL